MLAGLATRLGKEADIEVVCVTTDFTEIVGTVVRERPAVLITEIDIEGADVFGLVARVARHHPATRVVIYTAHPKPACAEAAFAAGAIGFFSKSEPAEELVQGVRAACHANSCLLGSSIQTSLAKPDTLENGAGGPLSQLTRREVEVLCLIGRGMSRTEIAKAIRRSPKTVDAHRSSIVSKLGFKDRVQLARFAIREGIVSV